MLEHERFEQTFRSRSLGAELELVCDQFEQAWRLGQRPQLDEYLNRLPNGSQAGLFLELLHLELLYRRRAGDQPTRDEYAVRFPDLQAAIDQAWAEHAPAESDATTDHQPEVADRREDDKNLLLGLLGVQLNFVSRPQLLTALRRWKANRLEPLAQVLLGQGALDDRRRQLLEALVQEHLQQHDDDPQKSLAALSSLELVREALDELANAGMNETLAPPMVGPESHNLRFRILRPHARGGLGEVYVANDSELHRDVALKQIQDRYADHPESRSRFVREAEITGGLEHPGIVPVYGLGTYGDGRPYYAMRFIKGDSLKEALERFHSSDGPPSDAGERAVAFRGLLQRFIDVCNAVDYAHSRGVLHRDLKPGNIMLGKFGETLVVDWGLAKSIGKSDESTPSDERTLVPASSSGTAATQQGSVAGSPPYMSPEQAAGRFDTLGFRSDVYSLGATLYQVLTGLPPVVDKTHVKVLERVQSGDFPRPRQVKPKIPLPLEAICLRAMALDPAERYPTPHHLSDDIEHWLADEPVSAWREPWRERLARWSRRHRSWTRAAAAAISAVAVVAILAALLVDGARRNEAVARQEAEASFLEARRTVDNYFTRVSENKLLDVPGLQPLRRELLEEALTYYRGFLDRHQDDPALAGEAALALYRVGLLNAEIGSRSEALATLQRALAMQQPKATKQGSSAESRQQVADTWNAIGNVQQQLEKLREAQAAFVEAQRLREALTRERPDDALFERKLANSYNNQAVVATRLGDAQAAMQEYERANAIRSRLVEQHPDEGLFRSDLAKGQYNLGLFERGQGNLRAAVAAFEKARNEYRSLIQTAPKVINHRRELAVTERVMGDVLAELGQRPEAQAAYEAARKTAEQLARQNPFLVELQADVAAIYLGLGRLQATSDPAKALEWFDRATVVWEQLVSEDPQVPRYRRDLAACNMEAAMAKQALGRVGDARQDFERASAAFEKLVKAEPTDPTFTDGWARCSMNLGCLDRLEKHLPAANAAFRQALEAYEKLNARWPTVESLAGQANAFLNLALVQYDGALADEAIQSLAQAARLQAQVVQRRLTSQDRGRLAEISYLEAVIEGNRGNLDASLAAFQRTRDVRSALVEEDPSDPNGQALLGTILDEMAVVLFQSDRRDEALSVSTQATGHLRAAFDKLPDAPGFRQQLASHYGNLAALERESDRLPEAAALLDERRALWPNDPEQLFQVAGDLALVVGAYGADGEKLNEQQTTERNELAVRAVRILKDAIAAGFKDFERLRNEPRFTVVRDLPAYKMLLP